MTLEEQILLIDQYIRKEPDTTIKDYLEAVKEIELVERSMKRKEIKLPTGLIFSKMNVA